MRGPFILVNIAHGTGPYLRTTELALAVATQLAAEGHPPLTIIVPLVAGERQRAVMREQLGAAADAIVLDETYGALLRRLHFGNEPYAAFLTRWRESVTAVSAEITAYLRRAYGDAIAMQLARAPLADIRAGAGYHVSFGLVSEIWRHAADEGVGTARPDDLHAAADRMETIERAFALTLLAEPGTFAVSASADRQAAPPTMRAPAPAVEPVEPGVYLTVTGVPGLERLFDGIDADGLALYANVDLPDRRARHAPPSLVGNPAIRLHVARSGWSSVWLSLLTGTPFVAMPYDATDDPEIHFNNRRIEALGIGTIYRGQPLRHLLDEGNAQRPAMARVRDSIAAAFGTLDGIEYCARAVARHFLGRPLSAIQS